jgi:hypothetical protein
MTPELRHRDPLLFWTGAAMLLMLVVVTLLSIGDTRQILGVSPWLKPAKFMISITVFLWTMAWFMPETAARPGARAVVRWTIASAMAIEIALITMQSARGTTSHFNAATPFDTVVFNIMGIAIVLNTLAMVLFLAILRRDTPAPRAGYLWGIRLGVVMFLLASAQGGLIVGNNAHAVAGPDGGPGLPFVNWSTEFGDLRVAHFVGLHALQALPLLGFLLDRGRVAMARQVVIAAGALWLAVAAGLLYMALQGRPLLAL